MVIGASLPSRDKRDQQFLKLIEMGIALSAENSLDALLEKILIGAKELTNADGGTLYLMTQDGEKLKFALIHNDSLDIAMGGTTGEDIPYPALPLHKPKTGEPNHSNVATHVALTGETINISDVRQEKDFDFSGTKKFDEAFKYRSKSFLTVPLKNNQAEVIGVLQLINSKNEVGAVISFDKNAQLFVEALSSQAAIAIDNQQLIRGQRHVMESFIEIIARAIDAKSPYTGAHCQRVPVITRMLAMAASMADEGPFKKFELDEDEWYALHLASWLHDCGKVSTPEYIVDKATKLETVHNRIHEIRTRFEVLHRDAEIAFLKGVMAGLCDEETLKADYEEKIKKLKEDFAFVASCNIGRESMSDDKIKHLKQIGSKKWVRHYDRRLGLSWAELDLLKKSLPQKEPAEEYLLEDREDHKFSGYNRGEIHNLSIGRGTLTPEEREKVNEHVKMSIKMLSAIPFPKALKNVPEYAAAHHERMDGKGYPKGLDKDQMSVPARIMAISDIFEALTSTDRPYKKMKKLSQAIDIMHGMAKEGHIDPDLFELFLKSGVYKEYAEQYMLEKQIDEVDIKKYLD